jgi:predicted esterase
MTWEVSTISHDCHKPVTVLLLHGFMQTADRFVSQVKSVLEEKQIGYIALQAPFPVYKQLPDRYRVGYSWYFYDPIRKQHVVPKSTAVSFAKQALEQLGHAETITHILGFSQGAYLSPHVAKALPGIEHVIGICGRFYADDFEQKPRFALTQIHGEIDQVVDLSETRAEHEKLVQKGVESSLQIVPETGHDINPAVLSQLSLFL